MEQSYYVFIDESGNTDLDVDKSGASNYLVYAAVVIKGNDVLNAKDVLANIHNNCFPQNHYLKSQHIPNDHKGYIKTIDVLTYLNGLEHFVYAIVIDKRRINCESGLSYKSVFIKYFNRLIADKLMPEEGEIHVCFDKTGYPEFQTELKLYMQKHGVGRTLFSNNTFALADDKEEPLLQIADFYAGTIGKYYCGKFDKNRGDAIHNSFLRKMTSIEWFPRDIMPIFAATESFNSDYNEEITRIAVRSAVEYLENYRNDFVGCELIRYILQETQRTPFRYISSKEIRSSLLARNVEIGDPIMKISELRDKGVLVISPIGKKGYKIPNSEKEIAEFYNRLIGNVLPQLRRCHVLNNKLFLKSNGKYNLLKSSEFDVLSKLCGIAIEGNR